MLVFIKMYFNNYIWNISRVCLLDKKDNKTKQDLKTLSSSLINNLKIGLNYQIVNYMNSKGAKKSFSVYFFITYYFKIL